MARLAQNRKPLTDDEREGIVLAVNSAFRKLKNLYARIVPVFEDFGFTPPSAGVIARDLSEKIQKAIIQHCESFTKGAGTAILPVRPGLGSKNLQGFRANDQPVEGDQRRELHRHELQGELNSEVDLGPLER